MKIRMDFDKMSAQLKKLAESYSELPTDGALRRSVGTDDEIGTVFRSELTGTASDFALVVVRLRELLQSTEGALRDAINDLAERDAAVSQEAQQLLALLESAEQPAPAPSGAADGAAAGAAAGAKGDNRKGIQ